MAAEPSDEVERPTRTLPRRLAPFIIVAGALASASIFIPNIPRERRVEFRLDAPATIVGLSVEWVPSSRLTPSIHPRDEESVHGAVWHFSEGTAPPSVVATVHLPDGPYEIHVLVERHERTDDFRRTLNLGQADQIAVPVR